MNLPPLQGLREDTSFQKKHWMARLQEVFLYPALAAVGLPCKYRINVSEELLVDLKPNFLSGVKKTLINTEIYEHQLHFLSQHRDLSDHFEEKLHAVQSRVPPYLMAISVADNLVLIFTVVLELSLEQHRWGALFGVTSRGATGGTHLPTEHTPRPGWWLCSRWSVL